MVTFIYEENGNLSFGENFDYYKKGFELHIPVISLKTRVDCLNYLRKLNNNINININTYVPYCSLEILENIFKLGIDINIYRLESWLFINSISKNFDYPNIPYHSYLNLIEKNYFLKNIVMKNHNISCFRNEELKKFINAASAESHYHEEIATYIALEYYSHNVDTSVLKVFSNIAKKYEGNFNKHIQTVFNASYGVSCGTITNMWLLIKTQYKKSEVF